MATKGRATLAHVIAAGVLAAASLQCGSGAKPGAGAAAGQVGSSAGKGGAGETGAAGAAGAAAGKTGAAGQTTGAGGETSSADAAAGAPAAGTGGAGTGGAAGAGVDGGAAGAAGFDGGADAPPSPSLRKNYQLNGMMPSAGIAFATKPGALKYTKLVIHDQFLAESCSIADYNSDGIPDISSGRLWYEGTGNLATTFKTGHPFREGHGVLPRDGAAPELDTGVSDDWADYPWDLDGDGWTDIINVAQPNVDEVAKTFPKIGTVQRHGTAVWYKNPGRAIADDPLWAASLMHAEVLGEHHGLADMNGDGYPELLGACKTCPSPTTKGYYQGNPADPKALWTYHAVTGPMTFPYGGSGLLKGIGAGDVDRDGHPDLLDRGGIWFQRVSGFWNQTVCTAPNVPAGCGRIPLAIDDGMPDEANARGPGHIFVADMDGDGRSDLVAANFAYGYGLYWYRQTEDLKFEKHQFLGGGAITTPDDFALFGAGFTAPISMQVVDMDGDGAPDVVTGKMRFALPSGLGVADAFGTPYLYVFKNVRGKAGPKGGPITLEPHKIDGDPAAAAGTPAAGMGVGRQFAVGHVNTDGIVDLCVATKVGLAVFLGQ
jgi:hypothetical protein